jgi:Putative phage tail protein
MPSSLIIAAYFGAGAAGLTAATAALGVTGLLAARFAINFAVSMIVTRVFSSSSANSNTDNGVRQQVPPATTNSLPIVYGDAYLGGIFVDAVLSNDQKTMYYVLAISQISPNGQFSINAPLALTSAGSFVTGTSYTIQFIGTTDFVAIGASANTIGVTFTATGAGSGTGLAGTSEKMYWQDQLIAFDATDRTKVISLTDGSGNIQTKIAGNLNVYLYTSNEAGTITALNGTALPSTVMGGTDIAVAQRWPSSGRQMNGTAFAIVKMVYNRDAGTTQMQAITFKASQYLNSTGVAKPGDVWYDYITNTRYGCAMNSTIVDSATATALNTYSDQTITYTPAAGGSATQARYRINGVLDTGQDVLSNLDQIMLACDSWNQYNAASGKWAIVINKADSASFAFDDSNIVGEIRVSAFDISSSINQIQAQFPSKLNRDQSDYVYLNTPSGLLFANEPVNKYTITLGLVNDSVQAQYLANRMLEQAREDLIVTFATTYNGIQVDAGDVISVTNAAYGWSSKLFRVIKVSEASLPDGNLGASLELNEYNALVYDDASITAFSATPNSNLSNPNFFTNLVAPTVANINTTATIPHFDVVCGVPATGRTTEITLFYTNVSSPSTTDWKVWSFQNATNSQPFAPSTSVTFTNLNLPTDTYYFAFKVANETGASALSATSTSFVWNPNPTTSAVAGTFLATFSPVTMQVPRNSSLVPSFTGLITQLYGSAAGGAIDFVTSQTDSDSLFVNNTWRIGGSSTTGNSDITTTSGLTLGSITDGGSFAQWGIPTAMSSSPATLTVPVRYKSSLGAVTQGATAILQYVFQDQGATGSAGTNGNQSANPTLYQWSVTTPSATTGSSTYTWATGVNSSYTGGGGWTTSIPTNPGTAGVQLWTAIKPTVVVVGTTTSTISWTSGVTVASVTANGTNGTNGTPGTNGTNGLQTARPTVYQWSVTLPASPTGTSTYTWSTISFTPTPSGWSQSITAAPSAGYTLWAATVNISDTATATTTTINWGLSSIIASGYAGTNGANGANGTNGTNGANGANGTNGTNGANGANGIDGLSSRICYAKSTLTSLNSTPAYYVTTGAGAFPPTNEWGGAEVWQATPPTISAGEALFQSDGIYNPGTTQTTWNVPYLSNLKVGSLSAITANTGNLTVSGTIQSNTAAISGTTMTGSGAVIYSSGNFAVGNSTNNITYNGTTITLNGQVVVASNINVTNLSAISANLGTITAGSLNINSKFIVDTSGNATIQSATSGARLLMQNNVIKVFDSAGVLRVQIGDLTA